jgi:heptosyltransferase-1
MEQFVTQASQPVLAEKLPTTGAAPRILIVRLSALGDIVFATSLLEGLRRRWPQAHIAWLAQQGFAGILDGDPRLNEVIAAPADLLRSLSALANLRRQLKARHFDWVIDAQGLLKSRLVAALSGARTRVGFASREPGAFLMDHLLAKGGDTRDISSEYRYLAEQITGKPAGSPRLIATAAAQAQVRKAMDQAGLKPGFIALCPFTTRPQKHWMEDYWPRLASLLAARGLGPCVLFGGPADRAAAARIATGMPASHVNLVGQTRLCELPAWLEQAGMVIGVDTGLTHIGIAMRRPTLALFGSTCPYTQGADSPLTVMYDALPCAPCRRHPTCGGAWTCMRGLIPERVAAAAVTLMQGA